MRTLSFLLVLLVCFMQGCCNQQALESQINYSIHSALLKYTDVDGLRYYTNGKVTDIRNEKLPETSGLIPRKLITVKLNNPEQEIITFRLEDPRGIKNIEVGDTVAVHGWLRLCAE